VVSAGGEKVLVVGPSWVGDMVMSQSLYIVLQQTRPGVLIDVLAPAWSEPILARMPQVRTALELPVRHGELAIGRRRRLGRELGSIGYDQAIMLPNSLKSALVPFFGGIPRRTGWRGEMRLGLLNDMRILDPAALPLMVQRFVALGLDRGVPVPKHIPAPRLIVDACRAEACREKFGLAQDRPLLALCPGAEFGGAKRWPLEHYAELARGYLRQGWQVALYGSDNDRPVTGQISALCGDASRCFDLAGRTALAEAVDMLSLSSAVVSNDSGLMHIAAALGRPMVVVYGATSPGFTPPLDEKAMVLVSDIDCAPCFERECPLGHHRCMQEISAARVAAKLEVILNGDCVDRCAY
jgi:heptosyltransferase-2